MLVLNSDYIQGEDRLIFVMLCNVSLRKKSIFQSAINQYTIKIYSKIVVSPQILPLNFYVIGAVPISRVRFKIVLPNI